MKAKASRINASKACSKILDFFQIPFKISVLERSVLKVSTKVLIGSPNARTHGWNF